MSNHKTLTDVLLYAYKDYAEAQAEPPTSMEMMSAVSSLTHTIAHSAPNADSQEFPILVCKQVLDVRQKFIEFENSLNEAAQWASSPPQTSMMTNS